MLSLDTVPVPVPRGAQALVKVHAASVNPVDYKVRAGLYPGLSAADLPMVLGRDLAGVVVAVGPEQNDLRSGDEVFAHLGRDRGGYAEQVIVEPGEWARKPAALSFEAAASLAQAGDTAWQGLFDHGGLVAGQRVLIQGATGGVGQLAVQLAHQAGAFVFATGASAGQQLLKELGADQPIDYRTTRFEDVASDLDLVFDLIGGDARARSWPLLKPEGVLVTTLGDAGFAAEARTAKREGRAFSVEPKGEDLAEMADRAASGAILVNIAATFPLDQAAEAQVLLERSHPGGKVVLIL